MNQLFKRALSVLLVVCLLCSALPSAFAAEGGGFTDVPKNHWAYDAITEAVAAGYFKGVTDTTFDPEGTLTRAMLVTVLARAAGAETDNNAATDFSDVASGAWYTGAVAWAQQNGVVNGNSDGTFAPDKAATRQETAAIFLRLLKLLDKTLPEKEEAKTFTDAADIADWAKEAVETMQKAGVLTGYPDGSFQPNALLTRAEAAALVGRFLKAAQSKPTPTEPTEPEPTEPTPTEPEPTEPQGPIHVKFVSQYTTVYVDGKAVTEVTLDAGIHFVEFITETEEGYDIYEIQTTSGRLASSGKNHVLAGLTEDTTVTLVDGLQQHTVTFNAMNGSAPVQVKVAHGSTVEKPADPTKTDDSFLGWHTASGEEWDFTTAVESDMTLYAYWLNDTYVGATVYLDGVKGSDANDGLTEDTAVRTFAAAAALISPKVTDGVIWVMHTVTVIDEQTWDLTGRDCVVKRAPSCTGNMILIDGGKLTLSNITIDGNMEAFEKVSLSAPAGNTIYLKNQATVTMNDGAVVTNCLASQGGGFYVDDSTLTMNGGKITNNKSKNTGGAIYIRAASATGSAAFTMNGGEISGNYSDSAGAAINVAYSYPVALKLLGGVIVNNTTGQTNDNACAVSATDDKTTLVIGGVKIAGTLNKNGAQVYAVMLGTHNGSLIPTEATDLQDPIRIYNQYTSSKDLALVLPEGLGKLQGNLSLVLAKIFVDAYTVSGGTGEDAYTLQQSDLDKITVRDIEGAYDLTINENNAAVLALVKTNDVVVYLSGYGKDTNDGLTTKTPVKTFEKAKEILKATVDVMETVPEDANFVISVVARVQIKEDCTLSFADFGDDVSRCVIRRDASYSSGYIFDISNNAKVTVEHARFDGNDKYLKSGVGSTFSISDGAQVTVNDGVEVANTIYGPKNGVFKLGAGKNETLLTINGGWYHDLTGYNGVFVYGEGTSMSTYVPGKCVVNDCLVEDVSGLNGLLCAFKFVTIEVNGGKYRDINMNDDMGTFATVQGGAKANLVFNAASEEDAKELIADVYLFNYSSIEDDYGDVTISQTSDGYITLGSAVNYDIVINGYYMTWGTTVAVGTDDYDLTQADLAHVKTGSGDSLVLKEKTNSLEIAKTR